MAARISGDPAPALAAAGVLEAALAGPVDHPYRTTVARLGSSLLAVQEGGLAAIREQYQALESAPSIMMILMSVDRVRGILASAMGEPEQAVGHFEDALTFTRRAGYRPEMAWVCYEYANVLAQRASSGDWSKAASLLEESLGVAQNLGMRPLMQRIEDCRDRLETQSGETSAYPDGLTQREVKVLCLLTQGKSNNQISEDLVVAEGTTRRHVANIYEKIGVTNRAEATRYALREGLLSLDETPSPESGP